MQIKPNPVFRVNKVTFVVQQSFLILLRGSAMPGIGNISYFSCDIGTDIHADRVYSHTRHQLTLQIPRLGPVFAAAQSSSSFLPSRGGMVRTSRPRATVCKFHAHGNYAVTKVPAIDDLHLFVAKLNVLCRVYGSPKTEISR